MCYDGFHRHWAFKVFYGCRSSPRSAPTLAGFFLSGPPTVQGKGARSLQRHTQNNPSYRVRNSLEDSPAFQAAQGFSLRGMLPSRKVANGIGAEPQKWSVEVRSVVGPWRGLGLPARWPMSLTQPKTGGDPLEVPEAGHYRHHQGEHQKATGQPGPPAGDARPSRLMVKLM